MTHIYSHLLTFTHIFSCLKLSADFYELMPIKSGEQHDRRSPEFLLLVDTIGEGLSLPHFI